ncbi:hypothetical protein C2S52_009963 [Perilla frutescens var. hirtella]|nr:hypothetical protein C2S52_009963 [Perilla frutescens var. hirtella]
MSMSLQLPPNDEGFSVETREASPSNFLIKIESFSLLSEYGIGKYESREFEGGDYKWKLIIYLDGLESEKEGDSDHVCVFVAAAGTSSLPVDWEINAIFTIFLYNQISDNYLCFRGKPRRFHEMKPKWGFTKLISKKFLTDPCNGYIVEDTCVFGAEVFVNKTQRVIERLSLLNKTCRNYKREWTISHSSKMGGRVWNSEDFTVEDYRCPTSKVKKLLHKEMQQLISLCDRMAESAKLVAECLNSENEQQFSDYDTAANGVSSAAESIEMAIGKWFLIFLMFTLRYSSSVVTPPGAAMFVLGDSSAPRYFFSLSSSHVELFIVVSFSENENAAKKMGFPYSTPFYSQNGSIEGIIDGLNFGSAEATILYRYSGSLSYQFIQFLPSFTPDSTIQY